MSRPALAAVALGGIALAACTIAPAGRRNPGADLTSVRWPATELVRAKNVVLFVGDGMGLTTVTAARILEGQLWGESGEENLLAFERLPNLALSKTYNTNQQVPDSAGTMTAMVTGEKTFAGAISVDAGITRGDFEAAPAHRLETLFEQAEARGLATGVVTTTSVTHATPAACYSHSPDRDWQDDAALPEPARTAGFPDIARQLIEFESGDGLDVVLGGGRSHFLPQEMQEQQGLQDPEHFAEPGRRLDGRDLIAEWLAQRPGSQFVWNQGQLTTIDTASAGRVLGLFAPSHLAFEHDRERGSAGQPSLSEMTATALEILSRHDEGFILMVEGGRIDHAHHASNAYRALTETIEFARAVQTVLDVTDSTETLVIVTADHGHVLTIAGYPTRGNDILGKVVGNDRRGRPMTTPSLDAEGLPYTTLGYQNGPGYAAASPLGPGGPDPQVGELRDRPESVSRTDLSDVDTADPAHRQWAAIPLAAETHSGEDVPVYAGGPGAQQVRGVQEQNFVYDVITRALGWNDPPEPFSQMFDEIW